MMQQHDIYFVMGVLLFFFGVIGYLSARSEGASPISSLVSFLIGICSVAYACILHEGLLKPIDFADSTLRIVAAIL
jgi:hypothetical protein